MDVRKKRIKYQRELSVAFEKAVDVMIEGEKTHSPDSWKDGDPWVLVRDHIDHASSHLIEFLSTKKAVDIEHAMTRLNMAYCCFNGFKK